MFITRQNTKCERKFLFNASINYTVTVINYSLSLYVKLRFENKYVAELVMLNNEGREFSGENVTRACKTNVQLH